MFVVILFVGCDMDTLEIGFGYTGSICRRPKSNYEIPLRGKFEAVSPNCGNHVSQEGKLQTFQLFYHSHSATMFRQRNRRLGNLKCLFTCSAEG